MQGLFYSVTATFTTLVFALILFVSEHFYKPSSSEFNNAPQTRAHAIRLLETLRTDVENMVVHVSQKEEEGSYECHVNMTRSGRTRVFTFPTLRQLPDEEPAVVQVTYVLEGLARQVKTRNGHRDLYRLSRVLDNGIPRTNPALSSDQIVDFLIELIPSESEGSPNQRIVYGGCPSTLDRVYVEFHVAIQEAANYINISRYSTTIERTAEKVQLLGSD